MFTGFLFREPAIGHETFKSLDLKAFLIRKETIFAAISNKR